ncbi:MAG: hypothetical protein GX096_05355 [Clostridiales bacterium]|nr:hypothetical protein [Clostridiales bacterium]
MSSLQEFYKAYPQQKMQLDDAEFCYRYHKNPKSQATIVLLTGGIGLSDLFYKKFSVITFDYQLQYANIADFCDAVAKVLLILSEDDHTFNDDVKQSLIKIMPNPKVITNLTGGYLALLVRLDKYEEQVTDFILRACAMG